MYNIGFVTMYHSIADNKSLDTKIYKNVNNSISAYFKKSTLRLKYNFSSKATQNSSDNVC